jgi:transcriptional regulator with XRE-family HTH domain
MNADNVGFATTFATITGATSPGKVRLVRFCLLGSPVELGYDEDSLRGDENMENRFSQQLGKLRRRRQLSQEQLASQLFVSRQSISKWEQGETSPDLDMLVKLANLLQVDLNELIGGEQPQPAAQTTTVEHEGPRDYLRRWNGRPMNGWEFLAGYWWLLFPLIGSIGWALRVITGH